MSSKKQSKALGSDALVDDVRRARKALWLRGGSTPEGFSREAKRVNSRAGGKTPASPKPRGSSRRA